MNGPCGGGGSGRETERKIHVQYELAIEFFSCYKNRTTLIWNNVPPLINK